MNENGKTIKQLADEIGVSKTAIRNKMTDEVKSKFAQTISGVIYIDITGESIIKKAFHKESENLDFPLISGNHFPVFSDEVSSFIKILESQLDIKDTQILNMQKSIDELTLALENTTRALNNSQSLHAGTLQQNLLAEQKEESIPSDQTNDHQDVSSSKEILKKGFWSRFFHK